MYRKYVYALRFFNKSHSSSSLSSSSDDETHPLISSLIWLGFSHLGIRNTGTSPPTGVSSRLTCLGMVVCLSCIPL